jgi:hypothetical protein
MDKLCALIMCINNGGLTIKDGDLGQKHGVVGI